MKKPKKIKFVITNETSKSNDCFCESPLYASGITAIANEAFEYFTDYLLDDLMEHVDENNADTIYDSLLEMIVLKFNSGDYETALDLIYLGTSYHPYLRRYIEGFVCKSEESADIFIEEFGMLAEEYWKKNRFSCEDCEGGCNNELKDRCNCHM